MQPDLPTGTVTFLFTDVEGSTRLLHELGAEGYAEALAEHRRLIREACSSEGGVEADTQGDAFFFAFASAPGAVAAAAAFTQALAAGPISVRVGLHTGSPLLTDEGYVGDDVHFAARVAAAGHGGQVVCSAATAELVTESLTPLGSHRLKDIPEPVTLHQLGQGSFPALKTIANTNLPSPASSFLGREPELAAADELLRGTRLLTISGPGGQGKTRFALELATRAREERFSDYRDGVFACFLSSLRDPALVLATIAQTLSVREQPAQSALDALSAYLQGKRLLLLVDNLEHLLACAGQLSELLKRASGLTLLVTSREVMRISGERPYGLPSLADDEGIALFCERAQVAPSPEIAELCARLEGLPLAIELAAARTAILTPTQLLERLSGRLDLLKGGRDADPRQQTLRATIEWSYDLLAPAEQELFARLSVFEGGCTLEAAEEVCDADLDTLQSLVEKSLLRFTNERFWMLETIREYAGERLADAGEVAAARQHHAHHVLRFTAGVDERIQSMDVAEVLAVLDSESDNIRAAFAWLVESDQGSAQLELVEHIWRYWVIRGALHEGLRWVTYALAATEGEESRRRAIALRVAAVLARLIGDLDAAQKHGVASLEMRRLLGDPEEIAHGLSLLASVAADREDYVTAQRLYEEAAALGRGGDAHTRAMLAGSLADVAMRQRDYERAVTLGEESLELFRTLARDDGAAWALFTVGLSLFRMDREDDAIAPARECLELAYAIVEVENIVWVLLLLGAMATRRGDSHTAATLVGAAEALRARSGLMLAGAEAELRETAFEELRASLTPGVYEAAFVAASSMSLDQAVEYALASID